MQYFSVPKLFSALFSFVHMNMVDFVVMLPLLALSLHKGKEKNMSKFCGVSSVIKVQNVSHNMVNINVTGFIW